jgi:hypothetical protein
LRAGVADDTNEAATPTAGLGSDNATLSDDAKSSTTAVNSLTAAAPTAAPAGPYDGGDLGSVNDIAVVSQRAEADLDQPADTRQTKTMTDPSPCPSSEPNVVVWQATLTYNGEAAVAHLVKMSDGSQVMQILRRAGCSLIASQDFAPKSSR